MSTIAFPTYVDEGILTLMDARGDTICAAEISPSERWNKVQALNLRRIAASLNFCRQLSVEGMERKGELDLGEILTLSLDNDPQTHFGPTGTVGVVLNFTKGNQS